MDNKFYNTAQEQEIIRKLILKKSEAMQARMGEFIAPILARQAISQVREHDQLTKFEAQEVNDKTQDQNFVQVELEDHQIKNSIIKVKHEHAQVNHTNG